MTPRELATDRQGAKAAVCILGCAMGLAAGCGPRATARDAAASDHAAATSAAASADRAASTDPNATAKTGEQAASCFDKCRERLADADKLQAKADALGDAPNVTLAWAQAGDAYLRAWRSCDLRDPAGSDRTCAGASALVASMAKTYAKAARVDGEMLANLIAIDARWHGLGAELEPKALDELRQLASRAEQQPAAEKGAAPSAAALETAVYARLALDDSSAAQHDADTYQKLFGSKHPAELAQLGAAIAAAELRRGAFDKALGALPAATILSRAKDARATILWHGQKGLALAGLGRAGAARGEFAEVLRTWGPEGPRDVAALVGPPWPAPMLDREAVVDAVGAALLQAGEDKAEQARKLEMPPYKGKAETTAVNDYVKGPVADWIRSRQQAVADAQRAYVRVREIKPVPPPRWVVAAAAATGQAWVDFAAAFTQAPMPPAVANDAELAAAWTNATAEASKQVLANGRAAFEACRQAAKTYGLSDDRSAMCEKWLTEHPATTAF